MTADAADSVPGIGLDLVDIGRFRVSLDRGGSRLRERLFTAGERAECEARPDPALHFAARFAAKEAAMKALGTGWTSGVTFQDIEVLPTGGRKAPRLQLHGKAAELAKQLELDGLLVSLSHSDTTAGAVVLANPAP